MIIKFLKFLKPMLRKSSHFSEIWNVQQLKLRKTSDKTFDLPLCTWKSSFP